MRIGRVSAIFRKELKDALRDWRTILAMVILPIIVIPIVMFLPVYLASPERQPISIAVIQMDRSSDDFIQAMRSKELRITILPATENLLTLIQEGIYELGLVLPENFAKALESENGTVVITVVIDESIARASLALQVVQAKVSAYSSKIVSERLFKLGLGQEMMDPIRLNTVSVARVRVGFLTMLVPMFLALYAGTGAIYFIIDTTAGEKERKTLEALLTMPITRAEILLGKFSVAVLFSLMCALLALAGLLLGAHLMPPTIGFEAIGVFSITFPNLAIIALTMLILSMTIVSLEMMLSVFAKSFKEAQNYLTPITFLLIFPAVLMSLLSEGTLKALITLPPINAIILMRNALLDKLVASDVALGFATSISLMVILLLISVKIFRSEKVLLRS